MKTCSRCKCSLDETAFARNRTRKDGLNHRCRNCAKDLAAARYLLKKEEILEKGKAYRKANPEGERERGRRRYHRNPEAGRMRQTAWRNANPHKSADISKRYKERNPGKALQYVFDSYLRSAEKRGHVWELDRDRFDTLVLLSVCHYCGSDPDGDNTNLVRLGIDRLDNQQGYTLDNTVPCCSMCNKMKNAYTVDMFLNQVRKINAHSRILGK